MAHAHIILQHLAADGPRTMLHMPYAGAPKAFSRIDENRDGSLSFEELWDWCAQGGKGTVGINKR